jgi:hypothetical protein
MRFPSKAEFWEMFGIDPVEEDSTMAYCRYTKTSADGCSKLDISFSAVTESFQVTLICGGNEVMTVSSEKVSSIELIRDNSGAGVRVVFNMREMASEAIVILVPDLRCHWWALRN